MRGLKRREVRATQRLGRSACAAGDAFAGSDGFGLVTVVLLCCTLGRDNCTSKRRATMGTAIHTG